MFKRAVRENGCRREELLTNHFPPFNRVGSCLSQHSPIARFLAAQAGGHSKQVLSGFYKSTGFNSRRTTLFIQGVRVPAKYIRFGHNAFCSECYHEGKELYFKDILFMSACPIHLRKYITSCPRCKIKLSWFSPFNQHCSCGLELISEKITADEAEPEIFLADLWRRNDQATFNKLNKILNILEYKASHSETSNNRDKLIAAIDIINNNIEKIAYYARQLLDRYPDVPQDLIKIKLSGLPGLSDEEIDRIFLIAIERPNNHQTIAEEFTLTRQQVLNKFSLPLWKYIYLKTNKNFPSGPKRQRRYTCAELEIISSLVEWGKSTAWGKPTTCGKCPQDVHSFCTADEAAALIKISRAQLKLILRYNLLESSLGPSRKILIKRDDLTKFTNQFMTIQSLAAQFGIRAIRMRDHIRERFPEAKSIGNQSLDFLLVRTEHAETLIREGIIDEGIIHEDIQSPSHHRKDYAIKRTLPIIANPNWRWMSVRQAATALEINNIRMKQWILNDIFTDVGIGKNGHYLIPTDQVLNFHEKYITPCEIAALLDWPRRNLSSILYLDGLTPTTGPLVDNSQAHLYLRSDAYQYINDKKNSANSSHPRWLSLASAKILLCTNQYTLQHLLSSSFFSDSVKRLRKSTFVARDIIEKFQVDYMLIGEITQRLKLPPLSIKKILLDYGILPLPNSPIVGQDIPIYRRSVILEMLASRTESSGTLKQNPSNVIDPQLEEKNEFKFSDYINDPHYTLADQIIKEFGISTMAFNDIFFRSGYITPLVFARKNFLDQEMVTKARSFLQRYYTCAQADKIFGTKSKAKNLISSNRLHEEHPLPRHTCRITLVSKIEVHRLADALENIRDVSLNTKS